MPDRWTPETENLVTDNMWTREPVQTDADARYGARMLLNDLADAGVLLPPGGERREDWGVRHPDGEICQAGPWRARADAEAGLRWHDGRGTLVRRDRIVWADGADYRGPWTEAE